MKKQIIISIVFAITLLSLSGCMGMHHLNRNSHGTAIHETANDLPVRHVTSYYSDGCH